MAPEFPATAAAGDPPDPASEVGGATVAGPPGQGGVPAPDAATPRSGDRRAWLVVASLPLALGGVALLVSLPVFFLVLAAGQALGFAVLSRRRKSRRADEAPGALRAELTPLGRAWGSLAWGLVLAASFLGSPPLRLLVCLLFACSVAAWPLARANVRRVRLTRRLDRRARVGSPATIEYRLENSTRRPAQALVVRDGLGIIARPGGVEACFHGIAAGDAATARALITFERRGRRRLRPVRISSRFPAGLFEVAFEEVAPAEVLVRPREGRATSALLARLRGPSHEAMRAPAARRGEGDPDGLREFRDGEDPRRIHWRTSARRGVLTYLERRDEGTRRVAVVLGRGGTRGPEAERRFERAVSVAATVVHAAFRAGRPCRLLLGDAGDAVRPEARSRRGLGACLDALAEVRPDAGRRPLAARSASARRADTTVVWVVAEDDDADEAVEGDRDAGRVLVLRATDPRLSRWVRGLP